MAYTYDLTTNRGKVRFFASDTGTRYDPDAAALTTPSVATCVFTDAEIDAFLTAAGSVVFLAAAYALQRLAQDEAFLANEIRRGAYENNRGSSAEALRAQARYWERQADEEGKFAGFIEMDWTDAAMAERLVNEELRESTEHWKI